MKRSLFKRVKRRRGELHLRRMTVGLTPREARTLRRTARILNAWFAKDARRGVEAARQTNRRLAELEARVDERITLRRAEREAAETGEL